MASPFSVFRKHQRTLIAVSGVILMLVFVVGDPLSMFIRGGGGGGGPQGNMAADAVAVRWNGGKITNAELNNLVVRRHLVNDLVQSVEYMGRQAATQAGVEPRQLRVEPIYGPATPQQGVESDVVRVKVFAQAARDAGMQVSDENVLRYLDELGRQRVSREQMRELMNRMTAGGRRASPNYLVEALREEMLARNYLASYQFALETLTPEQRWQDWLKVNDRIVVEAAAIPVDASLVDVPEPTEAELQGFFEQYKDREAVPDQLGTVELPSATPGFAIPRKLDVQYILAKFEPFLAKVEAEVTEEEIAKYYEEHKSEFIKADTSLMESLGIKPEGASPAAEPAAAPPATEGEKPATESPPATEPTPPTTEQTPPATEPAPPATEQTPPPAEQTPPPAEQTPAAPESTSPPAEEKPPAEPAKENQSQSERAKPRGPFRLAAFLQNEEEAKADPPASPENASAESKEAAPENKEAPPESAENKEAPAATTEEPAKPAAETPPAATTDQPAATPPATDAAAPAAATPAPEKPVEYQPLDQVRDVIRRRIAEDKVARQLIEQMNKMQSQLNTEFNKYFGAVLRAQDKKEEPPAPPAALADLAALAQQNGLEFAKTGPMSFLELREQPFGRTASVDDNTPLLNILFSKELALFQPKLGFDIDGNRFLVQKTSDTPRRVPELKEVRDEVAKAWKRMKAAELAQKRADELAKKAQDAGAPLADFFADDKAIQVVKTDPFSWYTGGDVAPFTGQQQPFRLGDPTNIVAAGPEFMQKVFELGDKQVAAVPNHDRSTVYVVRVAEHQFTPDQLHTSYLSEADNWPGLQIMTRAHAREAITAVMSDIMKSAGIEWQRPRDLSPEQQEAQN